MGWRYYLSRLGNKALVTTMKILISLLLLCACLLHPTTLRAAETTLDQASLKTMVEGLGYEPNEGKFNGTDTPYLSIRIPGSPWNYDITIYVDTDKKFVGLNTQFAVYQGPAADIPQSALLGLLSENADLTFANFRYTTSTKSLFLVASLRNKNISPADLRRVIDEIVSGANRTQKFWDPKHWPKSAVVEPVNATPEVFGASQK